MGKDGLGGVREGGIGPLFFYQDEEQKAVAFRLLKEREGNGPKVFTQLKPAATFRQAEGRHQKYCDTRGITPGKKG
ncbi:MAG: peptide-methionine (S)-S-oxide reductase [Phaeodactylibacter sp.]|nr:peptide-methionine (S)-S-oxide reductase [Phaeodactylibacter sp.]